MKRPHSSPVVARRLRRLHLLSLRPRRNATEAVIAWLKRQRHPTVTTHTLLKTTDAPHGMPLSARFTWRATPVPTIFKSIPSSWSMEAYQFRGHLSAGYRRVILIFTRRGQFQPGDGYDAAQRWKQAFGFMASFFGTVCSINCSHTLTSQTKKNYFARPRLGTDSLRRGRLPPSLPANILY